MRSDERGSDLLTVKDVARILRCGKNTIYDLIRSGALAYLQVGEVRGIREPRAEVSRYIASALRREGSS